MMKKFTYSGAGIPDDNFIRGEVPMTKAEVRAITMAKLRPEAGDTVVDVGAGTGSVSIECAFVASRVIAVEINPEGVDLIRLGG